VGVTGMSITTILMYNHNYKYTTVADCVTIYISMTMFKHTHNL